MEKLQRRVALGEVCANLTLEVNSWPWLRHNFADAMLFHHERADARCLNQTVLSAEVEKLLAAIAPDETRRMGGSLKTIEVARGAASLFLCPPGSIMHLWDLCAASIVLEEAGGVLTDAYGQPIDYRQTDTANRRGVVAANSARHAAIIEKLAPELD